MLENPIQIGKMRVKNRIVFPPMNTNLNSETGSLTAQTEAYYLRRAKGGAGLIVMEAASVSRENKNHPAQPLFCDETYIPAWSYLAEKLQRHGTKVAVELVFYGSESELPPHPSPSGISRWPKEECSILTREEIHHIQDQFAEAAHVECVVLMSRVEK